MSRMLRAICLVSLLAVTVAGCLRLQSSAAMPAQPAVTAVEPPQTPSSDFKIANGKTSTTLPFDLPAVRLKFKNDSPKKRVRLVLRRDGEKREVSLILRDLV